VALRCPRVHETLCLKRIVGLPGDRIDFEGGHLVLNGEPARYLPAGPFATESVLGHGWAIWPEGAPLGLAAPVVVPPRTVFLLNDKRADHDDSRTWGTVSEDL